MIVLIIQQFSPTLRMTIGLAAPILQQVFAIKSQIRKSDNGDLYDYYD
jgi:hypothetical protein